MSGGALSCPLVSPTEGITLTTSRSSCWRGQQGTELCFPQALGEEALNELWGRHMRIGSLLVFSGYGKQAFFFLQTIASALSGRGNVTKK